MTDSPESGNRRSGERVEVLHEIGEVAVAELDGQTGLLLNLCADGAAIQAIYPLEPGSTVRLHFRLASMPKLSELNCQVIWVDPNRQAGLKFLDLLADDRQSLTTWVSGHSGEIGRAHV